ncbi:M23 family metallopeptidase [Brevundimonas diminuta]|uniref:M23 family metallopeptidase n=1 Tax=Brevundimonas diminuta TaxID=293 RepID=UPI00320B98FF
MKALIFAVLLAGHPDVGQSDIAIQFCPKAQVRPYPLDADGRQQGLLLQAFTIVNRSPHDVDIQRVDLSLLDEGQVIDTRILDRRQIKRWGGNGPPLQEAMSSAPFLFCGETIIPEGVSLSGPRLAQNQGLIVANQIFAYDRERDALRVDVYALSEGKDVLVSATIPIRSGFARARYSFPLKGEWYVEWGASFHTGHRSLPFQEFALDLVRVGPSGSTHNAGGADFEDYYAYGEPVLAAADGKVVRAVDGRPEHSQTMRRDDESIEDYSVRHAAGQAALASSARDGMAGNYVVIDHGGSEFSFYAHLQPGSLAVKVGDVVKAGDVLGALGSSGQSTEPHLHFHVCDNEDLVICAGIPVNFEDVHLRGDEQNRAIQSGDFIATN